jgi:hypothetical protein
MGIFLSKLSWKQEAYEPVITKQAKLPGWEVATFKVELKKYLYCMGGFFNYLPVGF